MTLRAQHVMLYTLDFVSFLPDSLFLRSILLYLSFLLFSFTVWLHIPTVRTVCMLTLFHTYSLESISPNRTLGNFHPCNACGKLREKALNEKNTDRTRNRLSSGGWYGMGKCSLFSTLRIFSLCTLLLSVSLSPLLHPLHFFPLPVIMSPVRIVHAVLLSFPYFEIICFCN